MVATTHVPSGRLWLVLLVLCVAGVGDSAFERALFPTPLTSGGLSANPASLALVSQFCGHLGHERPFGLRDLAGHHLLAAAPSGRLRAGLGIAARGPEPFREQSLWAAVATTLTGRIDLGVGMQTFRLEGGGRRLWQGLAPIVGARVRPRESWRVDGWIRPASGRRVPHRGALQLRHQEESGWLSLGIRARGRRSPRLEMGLQLWLADGVRLTLDGIGRPRQYGMGVLVGRRHLSTGVHLRTHTQLGTTPAWFLGRPCGEGLVAAPARAGDLHPQDEAQ